MIVFSMFLFSCKENTEELLKLSDWKHNGGYHVGDWMSFENEIYQISNDTIFKNKRALALVKKTEYRIDQTYVLEIKSLESHEVGFYCSK